MPAAEIDTRPVLAGVTDPFPGFRPFEPGEEPIFRGRQQHTDELLRRLGTHRFLAVVGTSGSGKSSLVRAGLLPALDRGYLAGATSRWRIAIMRPGMAPIENLAQALSDKEALGSVDATGLRSSSLGLVEAVREAKLTPGESLLVVADQFEELFRYQRRMTDVDGGAEAALFVSLLLTGARRPDAPVYVVLTMRSDFLGDCAQFPGLPEALSESQYLIPRLTREQRRQAIEEPLRLFGATMTPQLVEQLLNDSGDEISEPVSAGRYRGGAPDPLPVLQHALMRTYVEWKSRPPEHAAERIDLDDYRKAGRMSSALDRHADDIFTKHLDEAGRRWTERVFRCLTTTELGRPVRRPTPLAELYKVVGAGGAGDRAKVDEALGILQQRENSFLQIRKDTTVDISHESLIWKWKRFSDWVAEEAESAALYLDLVKDAQGKATWGDPKLSHTLAVRNSEAWNADWARQYSDSRFEDVEAFLERSRRAVRNQKILRWFGAAAAVVIVILGVWAYYSVRLEYETQKELGAVTIARDSMAKAIAASKQNETTLADRIAGLDVNQGKTKEERDQIAKQKADLEAQLKKSQEDTQKQLAAQAQQSTDLLSNVKSLQSRVDAATQASAEETKKRQDAESAVAQLQATVNSLTKELADARQKAIEVVQQPQAKAPTASTASPKQTQTTITASPQLLRTLEGHIGPVRSVAWSPDGKTLASGGQDKTVRLWDTASGKPIRTLQGHTSFVLSVSWSPDGKTLASGDFVNTIRLWDAATGKLLRTFEKQGRKVAWSPDGKILASAGDDIRLWEAATGKNLSIMKTAAVMGLSWRPDGSALASGGLNTIQIWDRASGKMLRALGSSQILEGRLVTSLAWNPDGKTLASTTGRDVNLLDAAIGIELGLLQSYEQVVCLAWSPDGTRLAYGGGTTLLLGDPFGKVLLTWRGSHGYRAIISPTTDYVTSVAWSPDGKTLASGSMDETIRLWGPF